MTDPGDGAASDNPLNESGAYPLGLGTFLGVFTPTVLTILGVIMYLRFGWVVGNAGLYPTLAIVLLANGITFVTARSLSSIATNMRVGVGGAYYVISRSLGPELGGAIGLPLFLSQAVSLTLYCYGLAEALRLVWPALPIAQVSIEDCGGKRERQRSVEVARGAGRLLRRRGKARPTRFVARRIKKARWIGSARAGVSPRTLRRRGDGLRGRGVDFDAEALRLARSSRDFQQDVRWQSHGLHRGVKLVAEIRRNGGGFFK